MKIDWLHDVLFLIGLGSLTYGVFTLFGAGWAFCEMGIILLAISIYGSRET